jgi:drug/metabolite transporter (DMT)-like permease
VPQPRVRGAHGPDNRRPDRDCVELPRRLGGGGALAFILWVMALQRTTPTLVANTMTVNPIAAGLLAAQLVGEPITLNLVLGLVAVFAGIWIATISGRPPQAPR